jgi:hypothetical protein
MSQTSTQTKRNPWLALLGLAFLAVFIGVPGWFVVRYVSDKLVEYRQERAEKRREEIHLELVRKQIKSFVASSLAVEDWHEQLCSQGYSAQIFTADLQHVFSRANNRPILVFGELKDIKKQEGDYLVTFESESCGDSELRFELVADSEQAREVFGHRQEQVAYYVIAAQTGLVEKDGDSPTDSNSISQKVFVVHGRCSSLLFIGLDGFFIHQEQTLPKKD